MKHAWPLTSIGDQEQGEGSRPRRGRREEQPAGTIQWGRGLTVYIHQALVCKIKQCLGFIFAVFFFGKIELT